MKKKIPLYKPYMPCLFGVKKVLRKTQLGFSKYGKLFESSLKKFIGNDNIRTISSFNIAYFVLLTVIGLKPGDEVIMSPLACLESTQPIISYRLKIKWVDVDPNTGTISPDKLKTAISDNTKLIIHNHFCGNVGYIDEINSIARYHGITVIDDCIEAFGSEYKGNKLGNVGTDYTIFSFSYVRYPNTLSGAAIVSNLNNVSLIEKIRDNGINRLNFRLSNGEINPESNIDTIGFSGLMSELNSFIGYKQMKKITTVIEKQRRNALLWNSIIKNSNLNLRNIYLNRNSISNYWIYGILTDCKDQIKHKLDEVGLITSSVHINNNIYSIFSNEYNDYLEGVESFLSKFLALPSGWWVRKSDILRGKII